MRKYLLKNEELIVAFYWLLVITTFWLQAAPQTSSLTEAILFCICLPAMIYFPCTYLSKVLLFQAMKEKNIKKFVFQFMLCSLLVGGIFVFNIYIFYKLEDIGVFEKSDYFNLDGIPFYTMFVPLSAGMLLNICICGVRFCLEYIKLQRVTLNYQLRTLQQQVTPHFMFNVLNHIHILMQSDVELASSLLLKYSDILRYQLYKGEQQHVTLGQDIQFLKDFIAIEEVRWGDKLTVTSKWEIENKDKEIPSLLFITFIENAFKHVSRSNFEKGYILIDFKQSGEVLYLNIENSKSVLKRNKSETSGIGLKNAKERLDILYPQKHSLIIKETETVFRTELIINT